MKLCQTPISSSKQQLVKKTIPYSTRNWITACAITLLVFGSIAQSPKQKQKQTDPVLTFKLSLPQATNIIYSLRNSTFLDAKTANELADILVYQANDTTMNKLPQQPQRPTPKHK